MKMTIIKIIVSAFLCVCIPLITVILFSPDKKEEIQVTVLRFTVDVKAGNRVLSSMLQEIKAFPSELPEGVISMTVKDISETPYYTKTDVFAGDYMVNGKAGTEEPVVATTDTDSFITNQDNKNYVTAKATGGDCYAQLQNLIYDNPNKTIYLPDGVYNISQPLVIPTEPDRRVSLRLSQYAVIAVENENDWVKGNPLVRFTSGGIAASNSTVTKSYISGGTIDSKNVATAIKVEGNGNVLINHIAVKNFFIGIHLMCDNVDVYSITGTGNRTNESIGILVDGSYNTITNVRMMNMFYGIKLLKGENTLRNIHPLFVTLRGDESQSVGFWDLSKGNFYDLCYSDQFAKAFKLADGNASVLNGCFAFWYKGGEIHWGIHADGKFNSVVYNTAISMLKTQDVDNAYIKVDEYGGTGKIVHPYGGELHIYGDDHPEDFTEHVVRYQ